jgi:tetratricopeptide (TPR) repeat protein
MKYPQKSSALELSAPVSSRWFYSSGLDLIIGCGAWSLPLLLLLYAASASYPQPVTIAFYALALVFNYPHYMATIYRAYRTREDFSKYKIFTLHLTVLAALVLVLAHFSYQLLALAFTIYLTWSPFHYTGQNFGIALMFARRNGVKTTPSVRRAFYLIFLASYGMLFLTVHSLTSADQYILSLGIPPNVARLLWIAMAALFVGSATFSLSSFVKQVGWRKLTAPLVLVSTQIVWFVLPTALTLFMHIDLLQARSTAGILAVMHSAQYLWITSYYARREARAEQTNEAARSAWRPFTYFSVLVVGGIALFVPGPWLASRLAHIDFMSSFLAFTALVNIHHFLLDGAIWKLRDGRIAALLLNSSAVKEKFGAGMQPRWFARPRPTLRWLRVAVVPALILLAGLDQLKFYYGAQASNTASLQRAQQLNPYDSALHVRLARALENDGNRAGKREALENAVQINPTYRAAQLALARVMIESGDFAGAYAHYQHMFSRLEPDADSLVNFGIIAAQLRHDDEAITAWQKAIEYDPNQLNAHLRLAYAFSNQKRFKEAVPHYEKYLALVASEGAQSKVPPTFVAQVVLQLAEACRLSGEIDEALHFNSQSAAMAQTLGDNPTLALALMQSADIRSEKRNDSEALVAYQRALTLENSGRVPNRPVDWLRFSEFLRRVKGDPQLAYTCLVQAQSLLNSNTSVKDASTEDLVNTRIHTLEAVLEKPTCQSIRSGLTAATVRVLTIKYDEIVRERAPVLQAASLQRVPQK